MTEKNYRAEVEARRILDEIGDWLQSAPTPIGSMCLVLDQISPDVAEALTKTAAPVNPSQSRFEGRPYAHVGKRIQAIRNDLGLSQWKFARLLDVPEKSIFRWETGRGAPSYASLEKIDAVLKERGIHRNLVEDSCMLPVHLEYSASTGKAVLTISTEGARSLVASRSP